jgi:putative MATE family efflux protein
MTASRAQRFLEAPILPTLARLAAPGVVMVVFQSAVSIADTHFVGRLGTEQLAGLALVFPLVMLLQMTSAGAMGGGVTSAVARALGAGNERQARALVVHALAIAACMGLAFSVVLLALGQAIYKLLGGKGEALAEALRYSNVLFAGAILVWLANTLASVLRGAGNTLVPAIALIAGALVHIPLSGMLVLGIPPLPQLGIAGAGVAYVIDFGLAACAMAAYVWKSALRPKRTDLRLEARLFRDILSVGAISSFNALQTVLTAVILTGFVGSFGTAALAGYGVGVRLELLQIPLVFAIGQAMVALVGTNIGAGRIDRAKRIAWTGTAFAACLGAAIGITVSLVPSAWVGLFSSDPDVLAAGMRYLRIVGPCYAFLAVGVALYFASQGAARMMLPVLAGTVRLAIAIIGGALAVALTGPMAAIFAVIAAAMVTYGTLTALAVAQSSWRR